MMKKGMTSQFFQEMITHHSLGVGEMTWWCYCSLNGSIIVYQKISLPQQLNTSQKSGDKFVHPSILGDWPCPEAICWQGHISYPLHWMNHNKDHQHFLCFEKKVCYLHCHDECNKCSKNVWWREIIWLHIHKFHRRFHNHIRAWNKNSMFGYTSWWDRSCNLEDYHLEWSQPTEPLWKKE